MTNVTTGLSDTFKLELLKGNMSFFSDQMRVSLIKENSSTVDSTTTNWTTFNSAGQQPTGNNYDGSGGGTTFNTFVTGAEANRASDDVGGTATAYPKLVNSVAVMDLQDAVFQNVTVTADGCILYNSDFLNNAVADGDNIVAIFDFGGTVSATAGDFTIQFPAAGSTTSILRLA